MSADEERVPTATQREQTSDDVVKPNDQHMPIEPEQAESAKPGYIGPGSADGPIKPNDQHMPVTEPIAAQGGSVKPVKPNDQHMPITPETVQDQAAEPAKPSDEFVSGEGA
jgi:hypothetical protein